MRLQSRSSEDLGITIGSRSIVVGYRNPRLGCKACREMLQTSLTLVRIRQLTEYGMQLPKGILLLSWPLLEDYIF